MTAPVLTQADDDFDAGRDTVEYRVDAPRDAGPYTLRASLLYQSLSARFATELFAVDSDAVELRAFERMWNESDRSPVVIDELVVELSSS